MATVSGSFRRAMPEIGQGVQELSDAGVRVLSPADPRVVDQFGDFLFVASDVVRAIKLVQNRHLSAVAASDFLWLVAPDGYVGSSASLEIGFAVASGTPVFSSEVPSDLTIRQYVKIVSDPVACVRLIQEHRARTETEAQDVLLEPRASIDQAHNQLVRLEDALTTPGSDDGEAIDAAVHLADRIVRPLLY